MSNEEKSKLILNALTEELKGATPKGNLEPGVGINVHVQSVNTIELNFIDGLCNGYNLDVLFKRSGTGISIKFHNKLN